MAHHTALKRFESLARDTGSITLQAHRCIRVEWVHRENSADSEKAFHKGERKRWRPSFGDVVSQDNPNWPQSAISVRASKRKKIQIKPACHIITVGLECKCISPTTTGYIQVVPWPDCEGTCTSIPTTDSASSESYSEISHTQRVEARRSSQVSKPPNRLDLWWNCVYRFNNVSGLQWTYLWTCDEIVYIDLIMFQVYNEHFVVV